MAFVSFGVLGGFLACEGVGTLVAARVFVFGNSAVFRSGFVGRFIVFCNEKVGGFVDVQSNVVDGFVAPCGIIGKFFVLVGKGIAVPSAVDADGIADNAIDAVGGTIGACCAVGCELAAGFPNTKQRFQQRYFLLKGTAEVPLYFPTLLFVNEELSTC